MRYKSTNIYFCDDLQYMLSQFGFSVAELNNTHIMAARKHEAFFIITKDCSRSKGFVFSDITDLDHYHMQQWKERYGESAYFAIKDSKGNVWFATCDFILNMQEQGTKGITHKGMCTLLSFERWLSE